MTKRVNRAKELTNWDNVTVAWNSPGPDPRIQTWDFIVRSSNELLDLRDPFARPTEDEWVHHCKSFKVAMNEYKKRISRVTTKTCEIELHMKFGCYFQNLKEPLHPNFNETWIYLVRWREDGAFLESYHTNESKFGERTHGRKTNELPEMKKAPGLMAHWEAEYEKRENNKKQKISEK